MSLSDKITINEMGDVDSMTLYAGDVRESVRKIKERINDSLLHKGKKCDCSECQTARLDIDIIDEEMGEKLS